MSTLDKILKARSILILDHPFFGSLALRLGLIEDKSFESMAINGKDIYYNPKFVDSLTTNELTGVLAHEVMHIALGHAWRQEKREHKRWNIAGDYVINGNLIQTGFTLPKGHLIEPKYSLLSTEEIYNQLKQQQEEKEEEEQKNTGKQKSNEEKPFQEEQEKKKGSDKGKGNGKRDETNKDDPGGCGAVLPYPSENKQEEREMKAEWQAAISQAIQVAKGNLPASIKRQVQKILNPEIPWHILLRDFVEKIARNDYDWSRPSRRYIGQGIILPSLISEQIPEIVIAIDTSGSINEKVLSIFAAEASSILDAYDTTIRVVYCDTKVQKEEIFTRADLPMKLNPVGRGGTDFCPVFDHIKIQNISPACLIYFTDLYGRFPKQEAEYPTMWLTTTKDKKAPFGQTVIFKN